MPCSVLWFLYKMLTVYGVLHRAFEVKNLNSQPLFFRDYNANKEKCKWILSFRVAGPEVA